MPVGKKLLLVTSVMATGLSAALFFRKDASPLARWQDAQDDSPFRERVERRVAAEATWSRAQAEPTRPAPAHRVPTITTASISDAQPAGESQPTFQKSFNPVGALLEPIGSTRDDEPAEEAPGVPAATTLSGASTAFEHKIADGDTLSKLAERYLGRGERYLEIYELNRGILASPDLLPIGLVIKIPPREAAPPEASGGIAPVTGGAVLGAPQMVPVDAGR
jgi:nucleoid-associated protein YgaU